VCVCVLCGVGIVCFLIPFFILNTKIHSSPVCLRKKDEMFMVQIWVSSELWILYWSRDLLSMFR